MKCIKNNGKLITTDKKKPTKTYVLVGFKSFY